MGASSAIPVIDLFSGPGGLGEGFAQVVDRHGNRVFRIALSIEMDRYAHQTLQLRSFFRQFPPGEVAGDYYKYLRGDRLFPSQDALFSRYERQGRAAMLEAWQATLGETPPSAVSRRINEALQGHSKTKPWVLIGGPPCQAYSLVGRSRMLPEKGHSEFYKDKRHTLYREYLRLVRGHRPTIFIMENVKGLLSSRLNDSLIVESILRDLRRPSTDLKYRLVALSAGQAQLFAQDADLEAHAPEDFLLRAEQYGVPQCRHRLIIMGIRQEFASSSVGAPSPLRHESRQSSCGAAIADLPPLRSGVSRAADSADVWLTAIRSATQAKWIRQLQDHGRSGLVESVLAAIDEVQAPECDRGARFIPSVIRPKCLRPWFCDEKLRGACNHESRSHIQMDLWRYLFAACFGATCGSSPRICDFPRALLPSHANVREAIDSGKFNDRFRVQVADRPATTITAHISKDGHYFIHPDPRQVRSLTVREAARLQTFPDNYFFEGPRTEQYRQVGNAVPPLLAFKVARAIASYLCPGSIGDLGVGSVKAVLRA